MTVAVESDAAPRSSWLIIARIAWWVFFAIATLTLLFAFPARWVQLTQPSSATLAQFTEFGLPILPYAIVSLISEIVFAFVYLALALIIFLRRSEDRMALFTSFMLVAFGAGNQTISLTVAALRPYPFGEFIFASFGFAAWITFTQFPFLFPSGRYVPKWSKIPALIWFVLCIPWNFMVNSPFFPPTWHPLVFIPLFVFLWSAFLYSQIYRYARVSTLIERQQTKWVIYALAIIVLVLIGLVLVGLAIDSNVLTYQTIEEVTTPQALALWLVSQFAGPFVFLLLPVAFAFSILRYRLWDIDILIHRTLVYSVLTAILALFYFGAVVALQQIFRGITGQGTDLAIIVSTLALAALFNPLRRRVQNVIDHRFYRRKYDAQKILEQFAQTARDEVKLDKLTGELLRVVDETMQPTSVSLWLKTTEQAKSK